MAKSYQLATPASVQWNTPAGLRSPRSARSLPPARPPKSACPTWSADYAHRCRVRHQSQHRSHEVVTGRRIHPGGTQDHRAFAQRSQHRLSRRPACSRHTHSMARCGCIWLVRRGRLAVEHEIRGYMDHSRARLARNRGGQMTRAFGVARRARSGSSDSALSTAV